MEQFDTSSEPMDVDLSSHSSSFSSGSPNRIEEYGGTLDTDKPAKIPESCFLKKYHIQKKATNNTLTHCKLLMVPVVIILALLTCIILDMTCIEDLDLQIIKNNLQHKLHDQLNVIENIIDALNSDSKNKLLFLYGGTGVGKTFTVSILLDTVWNASNVFHYTMPSFTSVFSLDTMFGFSICKNSIIVIDDLKPNDLLIVKQSINQVIEKSKYLDKNVIIILVCNCDTFSKNFVEKCNNQFNETIEKSFEDVNAYKKLVKYNSLTQATLRKCIRDELGDINNVETFVNSFNASLDGCKGVYKKIKLLKIHKV